MRRLLAVVVLGVVLSACGGGGDGGTASEGTAAGGAPGKSRPLDAATVLAGIKDAVPAVTETIVYTPDNDPNKLLGRPGQYTSKAGFHDRRVPASEVEYESAPFAVRRGGDIEVFADEAGATRRADYIGALVNQSGVAFLKPEYIYRRGPVLLRISGALTPTVAAEYERALASVVA